MNLKLVRDTFTDECTIGKLFVDGMVECNTLEDQERPDGEKVKGETAIPRGTYQVVVTQSARFHRPLPLLVDVPNFEGIRIHPGNTSIDTEGCILPGVGRTANSVTQSRVAFDALFEKITDAIAGGEDVTIEVTGV